MKATAIAFTAVLALGVPLANAWTPDSKTDIRVVPPSALPELAQQTCQDLLLRESGSGTPYLYLEQNEGARLAIFDVSEPAHIRLAASIETGITRSYDFIEPVGSQFELVRFRDGSGSALLNLRNAKAPQFQDVPRSSVEPIMMLGETAYLGVARNSEAGAVNLQGQDVQVFDAAAAPQVLATVVGVTRSAVLSDTGTTFLLGRDGLTVVRRLSAEQQHTIAEMIESHN